MMMMVSDGNECTEETLAEIELGALPINSELGEYIHISIPSSRTKLLELASWRVWFKKLRLSSPLSILRQNADESEETSPSAPSVGIHLNVRLLANICKEWIKHPMNIALLIWLLCVATSGSMLGLLLLGLLDEAFPTKTSRNHWIEINNQILNALFTLMSIYQHPNLFHHLVILCRWSPEDVTELRKIYCKNGAHRPRERIHMTVVLVLLHVTCFAQYTLCGLYWGYSRALRPEFAENFFVVLGTAAPVLAGAYSVYSPLGREEGYGSDEESQGRVSSADENKQFDRRVRVKKPEWRGGLFDCGDDRTVGYLSFFCTFCVFGWNMERLGFGNMYVHIITFLLLCAAPFWIFNISALRIHDEVVGDMVGFSGIVLCVFGLLYGGFWRIQMRKRFKLPVNTFCCGSASLTDYAQWVFCWPCSLAQEVRTANFYDVEDDRFYRKVTNGYVESCPFLRPVPRETGSSPLIRSDCGSPADLLAPPVQQMIQLLVVPEQSSRLATSDLLVPTVQPFIQFEK